MPVVLIVHATRMGGTAQIAEAIGRRLRERGLEVVVAAADRAPGPAGFDAVVVGSALYLGRWLSAATRYLSRHRAQLALLPVSLFHSGPCGEGAGSLQVPGPSRVGRLARRIGCTPPVTFGGVLDPARATGTFSRWLSNGPYAGDYRDWDQIGVWADLVADRVTVRFAQRRRDPMTTAVQP